ncbi:response regulator transcription factor [Paenibacillus albidus]|uniref:response regulator transcription factor n=1 Tax=Paenibacillus albidus TaxID=2041023 RepID=UPI001BE9662E|nr:response regulator transcription factor [Paenibacillus albidus]MBT2289863.1 response regulator transcription factor [Paenibacillus albidus]
MINVLLVEDHVAVAQGTKSLLENTGDYKVSNIYCSTEVMDHIQINSYDVILLDLYMPDINGLELSKQILELHPNKKILIYTGFDISSHHNLLVETGVCGFISKSSSSEQILCAIQCVLRGETVIPISVFKRLRRLETKPNMGSSTEVTDITLNEREQAILAAVAEGMTNREIAEKLLYSQRSIEYILTGIFNKLKVRSRAEAIMKANKHSLITLKFM